MKVGLLGFGKTGRAVANVLLELKKTSLEWVVRQSAGDDNRNAAEFLGIDSEEPGLIFSRKELLAAELLDLHPVDVIIDFSSQSGLNYYLDEARKRKIKVISAVSHYDARNKRALTRAAQDTLVVYSPNITLGINFLICAAKVLQNIAPSADIEIIEEHFKDKSETSGTALRIADELSLDCDAVKTIRAGGIVGMHEILFGFPNQTVRLRHESISREAFGNGVLFAIDNFPDDECGFFTFDELLMQQFSNSAQEMVVPRMSSAQAAWVKSASRAQ